MDSEERKLYRKNYYLKNKEKLQDQSRAAYYHKLYRRDKLAPKRFYRKRQPPSKEKLERIYKPIILTFN